MNRHISVVGSLTCEMFKESSKRENQILSYPILLKERDTSFAPQRLHVIDVFGHVVRLPLQTLSKEYPDNLPLLRFGFQNGRARYDQSSALYTATYYLKWSESISTNCRQEATICETPPNMQAQAYSLFGFLSVSFAWPVRQVQETLPRSLRKTGRNLAEPREGHIYMDKYMKLLSSKKWPTLVCVEEQPQTDLHRRHLYFSSHSRMTNVNQSEKQRWEEHRDGRSGGRHMQPDNSNECCFRVQKLQCATRDTRNW